ncbi:MAG: hypothetical protein SGPRY_007304 [Prymnesium sp.]
MASGASEALPAGVGPSPPLVSRRAEGSESRPPSSSSPFAWVPSYFAALHTKLARAPLAELGRKVSILFVLEHGESYLIHASPHEGGGAALFEEGGRERADCTIGCSVATLLDLAAGRKRPLAALLRRQISLSGDRGALSEAWPLVEAMKDIAAAYREPLREEGEGSPGPLHVPAEENTAAPISLRGEEGEAAHPEAIGREQSGGALPCSPRQGEPQAPAASLRVEVHGASVHEEEKLRFAVYHLEVFEGNSCWTLTRRWSELRALQLPSLSLLGTGNTP